VGLVLSASAGAVSLEGKEPERPAQVAQLPQQARVAEPGLAVFTLRGRLGKPQLAEATRLVRAVARDVRRRFLSGQDRSGLSPVDVCLFANSREYRVFVDGVFGKDNDQEELGAFSAYRRLVLGNLSLDPGYLRHELVHVLFRDDFGPLPAWLEEGLASLYLAVKETPEGLAFQVDHRLAWVISARDKKTLPDLAGLVASRDREVYGSNYQAYYGESRYLLLFLERQGKLKALLEAYRGGVADDQAQLALLKKFVDYPAFLAWVEKTAAK
jgi:hypothetical protein